MKIRIVIGLVLLSASLATAAAPRLIEVIATKDNTFKVVGQKKPVITVKAGEVVRLRITSYFGGEKAKDGAVHSFTVMGLKDQGWDIRLYPGTKDYTLVAPAQPRTYTIICAVKCGQGHDDMRTKLVVTP